MSTSIPLSKCRPASAGRGNRIETIDLPQLSQKGFLIEASRARASPTVVDDGQIAVTEPLGRGCHCLQVVFAVGPVGVAMEVTPEVGRFDQTEQKSPLGSFQLTAVFSRCW